MVSLSVTDHPTAEWIAHKITEAFMRRRAISFATGMPATVKPSGDAGCRWASAITPLRHAHSGRMGMRRVIDSIRRECLDYIVILSEGHLRRLRGGARRPSHRWRPHPSEAKRMKSAFATWLAWGVLAVALLFLGLHLFSDHDLEVGRGTAVSTEQ